MSTSTCEGRRVQPWRIDKLLYKPWHIHKHVDAWITPISNLAPALSPLHFFFFNSETKNISRWCASYITGRGRGGEDLSPEDLQLDVVVLSVVKF